MRHLAEFHEYRRADDAPGMRKIVFELLANGRRKSTLAFKGVYPDTPGTLHFESGDVANQ